MGKVTKKTHFHMMMLNDFNTLLLFVYTSVRLSVCPFVIFDE